MWWDIDSGVRDSRPADTEERDVRNQRVLIGTALVVALSLVLASTVPAAIAAASLRGMLFYAALAAMVLAVVRREPFSAEHLTGWDQALMLVLASLAAGFLVDPQAVRIFTEGARGAGG